MNEKICIEPRQVAEHALSLKEFSAAQSVLCNELKKFCTWKPPETGFLKINVDEAMFSDLRRVGVVVVLRDEK